MRTSTIASVRDGNENVMLLDIRAAARWLGVSKYMIHNLIYKKELAAFRFGRVIRVRLVDLQDYAARAYHPVE